MECRPLSSFGGSTLIIWACYISQVLARNSLVNVGDQLSTPPTTRTRHSTSISTIRRIYFVALPDALIDEVCFK